MKKNRSLFLLAILTCLAVLTSGCSLFGHIDSGYTGQEKSAEILKYLSENDSDGLKNMFCERTRNSPDFIEEIDAALEFFEGEVTSHDSLVGITGDSQSVDNGKITKLAISPDITGITTSEGKSYEIWFHDYLINDKDESLVGITYLIIEAKNGERYQIGEYYE